MGKSTPFGCRWTALFLGVFVWSLAGRSQGDSLQLILSGSGLEGKPFLFSETQLLSGTEVDFASGFVSLEGQLELTWPDDGLLHLFKLRCNGVEWSVPVCGPEKEEQRLLVTQRGSGPFAARPGEFMLGASEGTKASRMGRFSEKLEEVRALWAVEFQRSMLWGNGANVGAAEVLGAAIDENSGPQPSADSVRMALVFSLKEVLHEQSKGQPEPVVNYMAALANSVELELNADRLLSFQDHWRSASAPDPRNVSSVLNFTTGLALFAREEALPVAAALAYSQALHTGNFDSLVSSTATWWGQLDADKTAAWLLFRLGRDAFGAKKPGRPFSSRSWSPAWAACMQNMSVHPKYGLEFQTWLDNEQALSVLPGALRAFNAAENLVRLEDVVGSGPAVWMWLDAGAPSTTVQLQVLEQLLASKEGRKWQRNMQWVVADAGSDIEAFQRLIRRTAKRCGGLSKMPFLMLHTGADLRWTRAFDLSSLPAMRMHQPDLIPMPDHVPLPGPELMLWLAKLP